MERSRRRLGRFKGNEKLVLVGDLKAYVGSLPVGEVVGPFGVAGVNDNWERLVGLTELRGIRK